ncbi:MAG TPA: hypothetical protein VKU02_18280 [Gemmataceae bacterium]|nr:hypothetical protein [Gemmataceae bacterium]
MFEDGSLTFREFMAREPLPLATIHNAVAAWSDLVAQEILPKGEDAGF